MSKPKVIEAAFDNESGLSGLLRQMIDDSGLTRYAIAKAAGINESTLSRMYTNKRPATMETIQSVCYATGRRLIVRVE